MQNFKDMQKLLRQNDAPTASNGGLLIPSSLDLETRPRWNFLEFFSVLRRIERTAATKTKPAGRPGRGKCNCTRKIQHYVYIGTNTKSKLLVFQKRRGTNRPLPPLPCVFQSRRSRRLIVVIASLPGMQLPTRSQ